MKPGTLTTKRILLSALIICITIGLVSWDHYQSPVRYAQSINDTTPKLKEKKIRDLDEALEELNKGEWKIELEKALKEVNKGEWKVELDKAMKELNKGEWKVDIEKAMKELNNGEWKQDLEKAMKEINSGQWKEEWEKAMKEFKDVDISKIQMDIKESLAKVDFDNLKIELDKAKNIDLKSIELEMAKLGEEMKELKPRIEKEMEKVKVDLEKVKVDMEKTKTELKEIKDFVDGLEKDGLIKKDRYEVELKNGELFIDGKKASQQTYNKYRSFLERHKNFRLNKSNDNFNIDMD